MERPLRLIAANPVDSLARTIEALLVVASQPLTVAELAEAAGDDAERIETALGLLGERFREGRSGIVLEQVAGGWAFRASREAAEACGRLFERPVERNLSQAALETLAVVAYMGPCSRPEIARWRGVAVDSVVAGLVERGLIAEAGRRAPRGAVRYRVTPLFERVFGLESLAALPRLEDLGGEAEELRGRFEVARRAPPGLETCAAPSGADRFGRSAFRLRCPGRSRVWRNAEDVPRDRETVDGSCGMLTATQAKLERLLARRRTRPRKTNLRTGGATRRRERSGLALRVSSWPCTNAEARCREEDEGRERRRQLVRRLCRSARGLTRRCSRSLVAARAASLNSVPMTSSPMRSY